MAHDKFPVEKTSVKHDHDPASGLTYNSCDTEDPPPSDHNKGHDTHDPSGRHPDIEHESRERNKPDLSVYPIHFPCHTMGKHGTEADTSCPLDKTDKTSVPSTKNEKVSETNILGHPNETKDTPLNVETAVRHKESGGKHTIPGLDLYHHDKTGTGTE